MDFWTTVALGLFGWAVLLSAVGFASDRKSGLHQRVVEVWCDRCHTHVQLALTSPDRRRPSESRWDALTVARLHELGWSAGVEPAAHHRHAPPDVCPGCRGKR